MTARILIFFIFEEGTKFIEKLPNQVIDYITVHNFGVPSIRFPWSRSLANSAQISRNKDPKKHYAQFSN